MTRSNPSPAQKLINNASWLYDMKPPASPLRQQKILYTPIWTAAHDQCFIDSLWDYATDGKILRNDRVDEKALQRVIDMVNIVLKEAFTMDQNRLRWEKLAERYETFTYLINRPKVHWDCWDNTMHAPSAFWEQIFQVH
ncbi:UNVERIFIED_CONTAM: hypothetical protein Sradi_1878600 [Sesamum radiatum]|uniref:Myb/SANT-like domain-containing protein n=1 Tax=Sesamum radiatum TaxID=300843 RepID=A0AAW2TY12_SESRA